MLPTIQQLQTLAEYRKSIRAFRDAPVPRDVIDKAIEMAGLAPSACNRQPYRFLVFDEPATVSRLARLPWGTEGFAASIPVLIVVLGSLEHFSEERDRHLIYIDSGLACMNLLLAFEAQGVSTCCLNWPDVEEHERKISTLLQLAPYERPVMFIAVGYPDPSGKVAYSTKKELDSIRVYNSTIHP